MIKHIDLDTQSLKKCYKNGEITFGGNFRDKIYGTLKCKAGKRMKKENRVFFHSEKNAIEAGFRPCGQCMRIAYLAWKMAKLNKK